MQVKPLLHPIVCPGDREKSAALQGKLKLHVRFYNRISMSQRPHNENWNAHYSLCAHSMATNASMSQRKYTRALCMCIFFASVASAPDLIAGFARDVSYTRVFLACI